MALKNGCSPAIVDANVATLRREGLTKADALPIAFDVARTTCGQWLFSYGSNSGEQLTERLGRKVKPKAAYAEGYQRVFRGHSRRWNGGVASLLKKTDGTTYGSATELRSGDLDKLDVFEGVSLGKYKRIDLFVKMKDGATWRDVVAYAYVSTSTEYNEPTRAYLEATARTVGEFWSGEDGVTWKSFPLR